MTTIEQIRFIVERDGVMLESEWVLNKCNEAQADFGVNINIPATTTINITTDVITYVLPANLKIINRLWLTSDRNYEIDKEFKWPYRIYNGSIIFVRPYRNAETLNVDYFRNMTYYTSPTETVDLPDRFNPLYTSFIKMEYYDLALVKAELGAEQARREWEKHNARYLAMQRQVISNYSLLIEPAVVDERW